MRQQFFQAARKGGKQVTQDQIILLLDLKASQERGAASMSCGQRLTIASELHQRGLIDRVSYGPSFYRINQKGLIALKKTERPPSKYEIDEIKHALEKVNNRIVTLKENVERMQELRK